MELSLKIWWPEVEGILMSSLLPVRKEANLRLRTEVMEICEERGYLKQLPQGIKESATRKSKLAGNIEGPFKVPELEFTVALICETCDPLQQHSIYPRYWESKGALLKSQRIGVLPGEFGGCQQVSARSNIQWSLIQEGKEGSEASRGPVVQCLACNTKYLQIKTKYRGL